MINISKKIKLLVAVLAVIVLGGVAFFVFSNKANDDGTQNENVELKAYANDALGIALDYPSQLAIDDREGRVTFTMFGPSQTEFTEVFDGVAVSFFRNAHPFDKFEDLANAAVTEWQSYGPDSIIEPLKSVKLADKEGFTFKGSAVGEYKFYFLSVADKEYLEVTVFVTDPTGQGFQDIVDDMLASLVIK